MKLKLILGSIAMICLTQTGMAQTEPYKNPALSPDERARDLLGRMTLEEKISQMTNGAAPVERLGIPQYDWWNEALHGVGRAGLATVFPQAIGMAATFDPEGVNEVFDMVSDEARAKYNYFQQRGERTGYKGLTFWTPNVNIFRDPRWGRGQETYGEDPYLTSVMGVAVVNGLQGDSTSRYNKAHACAKHYAVHSGPEWNRHSFDVKGVSARDLHETYLPAFKALVKDAKVKEVMCAYNRYEGKPCCSSKELLINILRDEWGYDDIIVSDCGAISDFFRPGAHGTHKSAADASADAVLTGTDLNCGGSYRSLGEAVEKGYITEADIDESVFRLLRARFQLGIMDDPTTVEWNSIPYSVVSSPSHRAKALDMARESITLLSNNGTLPLNRTIKKIAVLGPNATDSVMMWGNYNGNPAHTATILEGIKTKLPGAEIVYEKGCDYVDNQALNSYFANLRHDGKKGIKATYWTNKNMEGEPTLTVLYSEPINKFTNGGTPFEAGIPLENFSARLETVFVPTVSGPVSFFLGADDGMRLTVDGTVVIDDWNTGAAREHTYTLDVEAGKEYSVVVDYFQQGGDGVLRFDVGTRYEINYAEVASRVSDADAIIFVGGLSPSLEGEEMGVKLPGFRQGDRTSIELPAVQKKMIAALKATGRPVVFVVCTGSAIALVDEAAVCDAILLGWYPGEAGGTAIADVLFGDYNPAGRLPITFYASDTDLPDFEDYNMAGRTYRYFKGTPLFPFGHGLSYTQFRYGKGKLNATKIKPGGTVTLTVPVENAGKYDGDEVVQVYIRRLDDTDGPIRSLRAFDRVVIKAGEKKNIPFTLGDKAFESFDEISQRMKPIAGKYEISFGPSSAPETLQSVILQIKE